MAQLFQCPIDRLHQVVGTIVRHLHVAVSDDAKQVRRHDLDAVEQPAEIQADDVFEEGKGVPRRAWCIGVGDGEEPGQRWRNLDPGELRPALMTNDDRQILAAVRDEREGMSWIERQRREERVDLVPES